MCYPCNKCGKCGKFDPNSPNYEALASIPCLICGGNVNMETGICDACGAKAFAAAGSSNNGGSLEW